MTTTHNSAFDLACRYCNLVEFLSDEWDLKDSDDFSSFIDLASDLLDLSDRELSEALDVSASTVKRWRGNLSAPAQAVREDVFDALTRIAHMAIGVLHAQV